MLKDKCYIIANCYKPHVSDIHILPFLDNFLKCISKSKHSVLLTSDFNLPGINWDVPSAPKFFDQDRFLETF